MATNHILAPGAGSEHAAEVQAGARFEFGKNWANFLRLLTEERIANSESALRKMLGVTTLKGCSFLDIGSGSGLSSLAARRLGAAVYSFDYDPSSVACTNELRRRYFPDDSTWTVEQGSALDMSYLSTLGSFDVVYSWGVLHHTGKMWEALDNVHHLVAPGGQLFVAIYNDQGSKSTRWLLAKRIYNWLPRLLKKPWAVIAILPREFKAGLSATVRGRLSEYVRGWYRVDETRGMDFWHDVIDWVGGYPYEYAAADEIFVFYRDRGFNLVNLHCKGAGLGCIEYVFSRVHSG